MTTQAETAILAGCCFWDMYKKKGIDSFSKNDAVPNFVCMWHRQVASEISMSITLIGT